MLVAKWRETEMELLSL